MTVCKGFDGSVAVLLGGRRLAFRVLAEGEAAVPIADEKDVRERVDAAKAAQAARPDWKPAPDHPSRRPFKGVRAGGGVSRAAGGSEARAREGQGDISALR